MTIPKVTICPKRKATQSGRGSRGHHHKKSSPAISLADTRIRFEHRVGHRVGRWQAHLGPLDSIKTDFRMRRCNRFLNPASSCRIEFQTLG